MKSYIRPTFECFELKVEERLAGSINPCTYDGDNTTGNCMNGRIRG